MLTPISPLVHTDYTRNEMGGTCSDRFGTKIQPVKLPKREIAMKHVIRSRSTRWTACAGSLTIVALGLCALWIGLYELLTYMYPNTAFDHIMNAFVKTLGLFLAVCGALIAADTVRLSYGKPRWAFLLHVICSAIGMTIIVMFFYNRGICDDGAFYFSKLYNQSISCRYLNAVRLYN